jgi:hypothetical protein
MSAGRRDRREDPALQRGCCATGGTSGTPISLLSYAACRSDASTIEGRGGAGCESVQVALSGEALLLTALPGPADAGAADVTPGVKNVRDKVAGKATEPGPTDLTMRSGG